MAELSGGTPSTTAGIGPGATQHRIEAGPGGYNTNGYGGHGQHGGHGGYGQHDNSRSWDRDQQGWNRNEHQAPINAPTGPSGWNQQSQQPAAATAAWGAQPAVPGYGAAPGYGAPGAVPPAPGYGAPPGMSA